MAKKVELIENNAGGIDLITERDAGNEIRIFTGKKEKSIEFWKRLHQVAGEALSEFGIDPNKKSKKKYTLFRRDGDNNEYRWDGGAKS